MLNNNDKYLCLISEIYNEKFLFKGSEGNFEGFLNQKEYVLEVKEPHKIIETTIKYHRTPGEGCKECEKIFAKVIKLQRLIFNYLEKHPNSNKKEVFSFLKNEFDNLDYKDTDFSLTYGRIKKDLEKKKKKKNFQLPSSNCTFYDRPMEFPGFYKSLDLSKDCVKEIMIIGEAAGPDIATHINCTYGLSNTEINDTGKGKIQTENIFNTLKQKSKGIGKYLDLLKVKKTELKGLPLDEQLNKFGRNLENNLWEILYTILPISLEELKNKVYITDLVKCNAKGNSIWQHFKDKCFEKFLSHEIKIINPKLIIFLGNTGYDFMKRKKNIFDFDEFCPTTEDGKTNKEFLEAHSKCEKYLDYNFRKEKYLKRYYDIIVTPEKKNKNFADKDFEELTEEDKKKLIKKIPINFPSFGKIIFTNGSSKLRIKFIKIFHNSNQNKRLWKVYAEDYKGLLSKLKEDKFLKWF